jgi:hypothetical protein
METLIEESKERRDSIQKKWNKYSKRYREKNRKAGTDKTTLAVKEETLKNWVKAYPIMNECTHFACILDPGTGQIMWIERGVMED